MDQEIGWLCPDKIEKSVFETVHKNDEDEIKHLEDEIWKLKKTVANETDVGRSSCISSTFNFLKTVLKNYESAATEKLAFQNKFCSPPTPFVGILPEPWPETMYERYRPKNTLQQLLDDYWKQPYWVIKERSKNCREPLRPTNSMRYRVQEGFLWNDWKTDSLERPFHPINVKLLGCQNDMELMMLKDIEEKHRFRHQIANSIFKSLSLLRLETRHTQLCIDVKPFHKQFDGTTKSFLAETPNNSIAKNNPKDGNFMDSDIVTPFSNIICMNLQNLRGLGTLDFGGLGMKWKFLPRKLSSLVNDMDAADFTDMESGKTDMEMKMTQQEVGAWRAKDEAEKAVQWWHKPENEYSHSHELQLLLLLTLLSIITFLTALKIMGCKSEEGYKNNSSLNPICQIVNRYPYYIRLVIAFNSIAFYLSVALMLMIFNKLPLRPLLLVSAFSMLGAYMCVISGPSKPPLSSIYSTFYGSWKVT